MELVIYRMDERDATMILLSDCSSHASQQKAMTDVIYAHLLHDLVNLCPQFTQLVNPHKYIPNIDTSLTFGSMFPNAVNLMREKKIIPPRKGSSQQQTKTSLDDLKEMITENKKVIVFLLS
ncbi:hypothetical protein CEXT_97031 [Caerostris extrusa]|uniref:Uncharacterized protein n=1 Tax=Caerostris extrusa TaxID=172846 RepID=A0AAV4W8M0_CAEEX|nr:hypothetical protein CEXT_97031 [Caerostris extrusa]